MSDTAISTPVTAMAKYADEKTFADMSSGGFLPRVQLMGGNSDLVKEGKIGIGRWALVHTKENFVDLGPETNLLVVGWRPKAMDASDQSKVFAFYNPTSAEFKKVIEKSEVQNSSCFFGPEFLVWLVNEKAWAGLFMASKTARREAPNVKALLASRMDGQNLVVDAKFCTLKARLIKTARYSWHGPIVTQCSASYDVPSMDVIIEELQKFNHPPEDQIEVAPEAARET